MFKQFPALRNRQACLFVLSALWFAATGIIMAIGFGRQSTALTLVAGAIGVPVFLAVTCVSFPEQDRYFSEIGRQARYHALTCVFAWTVLTISCFYGVERATTGEHAPGWTATMATASLTVLLLLVMRTAVFAFSKGSQPARCQA